MWSHWQLSIKWLHLKKIFIFSELLLRWEQNMFNVSVDGNGFLNMSNIIYQKLFRFLKRYEDVTILFSHENPF